MQHQQCANSAGSALARYTTLNRMLLTQRLIQQKGHTQANDWSKAQKQEQHEHVYQ
jgi:hypothetical protein